MCNFISFFPSFCKKRKLQKKTICGAFMYKLWGQCYTSLWDRMRHNSANNMTYIPNEGVDMHRDADPGASSVSYCNTMDIIITSGGDFKLLWVSSCSKIPNYLHSNFWSQQTDHQQHYVTLQDLIRFSKGVQGAKKCYVSSSSQTFYTKYQLRNYLTFLQ